MRGLICYYSGSGNTQLACEAIAARVGVIDFELFDVTTAPSLSSFTLVFTGGGLE